MDEIGLLVRAGALAGDQPIAVPDDQQMGVSRPDRQDRVVDRYPGKIAD